MNKQPNLIIYIEFVLYRFYYVYLCWHACVSVFVSIPVSISLCVYVCVICGFYFVCIGLFSFLTMF